MIPDLETSALILIDVQEKFSPVISNFKSCVQRMRLMLASAKEMSLPLIVAEQYPKGLGRTLPELASEFASETPVIEKTSFSCFGSDVFRRELAKHPKDSVILMGIETHVCVQQTAFHALERGYEVFLLADAVSSRRESDHELSLSLMRQSGIHVTTAESLVMMLVKDSSHPSFKAISKLIR